MPSTPVSRSSPFRIPLMLSALAIIYVGVVAYPVTSLPLRQWDESRLCMNALEMVENQRWLVPHYTGTPDMWNTKPPMMIWAMVLSLKTFGLNHTAARLPATLAGGLAVLLVAWFIARRLSNAWTGFLAGLVLATSFGFVASHAAITADYDVPLTLSLVVLAGAWFQYLETGGRRYLAVVAVALACAVLTKSAAALMPLPALVLYTLWRRRLWSVLKDPYVYLAFACAVAAIATYYLAREAQNPGYLAAVGNNELWGRYLQVNERHEGPASFYLRALWAPVRGWTGWHGDARLVPWLPLAALGTLLSIFGRDEMRRQLARLATVWAVSFLVAISVSKTKLFWYDVPLYPATAILAALALDDLFERSRRFWASWPVAARVALLVPVLAAPATIVAFRLTTTTPEKPEQPLYLKQLRKDRPDLVNLQVAPHVSSTPLRFYVKAAAMQAAAAPADRAIDEAPAFVVCDQRQWEKLAETRSIEVLHKWGTDCSTVRFGPKERGAAEL